MLVCFFLVSIFGVNFAFAQEPNTIIPAETGKSTSDFTSPDFRVNLTELDPINHGTKTAETKDQIVKKNGDWKSLFQSIMSSISNLLLMLIPLLAAISLIIAGYFYIFSGADSELVGKAKNIIKYNLIAMLVAFLSYVIIATIASFFK